MARHDVFGKRPAPRRPSFDFLIALETECQT